MKYQVCRWLVVFSFVSPYVVWAEEGAVFLPEIVVTATRTEQEVLRLPYSVSSVQSADIQIRQLARTTPEVLKEVSSVMIQKTGHAQGSPFIRGFTGFRTLLLIDGIRLNNSVFRDGPNQYWNTVDPFMIKSLELIKGPGSVLYGSDAIGGTVNVRTFSPFDMEDEGGQTQAYYRYSTAEESHTLRLESRAVLSERFGVQAGVTYKDFGDLRAGRGTGRQPATGYDEVDYDLRLDYFFRPHVRFIFAHQSVEQNDAWRSHKTILGKSFHGTTIGKEKKRVLDQDRQLSYAQLRVLETPSFIDTLDFTLSYHVQEEEQFRIKKDDASDRQGFEVHTLGASLEVTSVTDNHEWVYGSEYYRDSVDSFSRKFNADGSLRSVGVQGPVADDASYESFGVYVQDTLFFGERFDFVFGARYNYIHADAGRFKDPTTGEAASFSDSWDAFVGSGRVLYRLFDDYDVHLFGGVSQGFRAPNLSDLTRLDTARTDELETPSTDLDPEEFVAYEFGFKGVMDGFSFEAAYFYTDVEDLIVRTPTGELFEGDTVVIKKNGGGGYVQGLEFDGRARLSSVWTLWGNITWMDGEVDTFPTSAPDKKREPINRLMPLGGNVGLRFEASGKYWMEAVVRVAGKQDRLSTRDESDTQRIPPGGTPGYAVATIRGGCAVRENINLSVALENVADKNYRIHGSGVNEAGRNFVVSLKTTF